MIFQLWKGIPESQQPHHQREVVSQLSERAPAGEQHHSRCAKFNLAAVGGSHRSMKLLFG